MSQFLPSYGALKKPLSPLNPKWLYYKLFRLGLTTLGRLSSGIRIGLRYGFDSGVTLDYVYRNQPQGITPLGKFIDQIYLNSPGWQGIRQRGEILKKALRRVISEQQQQEKTVYLLDVACGGGRYDLEVLKDFPPEHYQATLRDYKPENVQKAQTLAEQWGVTATIEQADAFSDEALQQIAPPPNLIVVSGLHEILPDNALVSHHFQQLAQIIEPEGTLIFTIQPFHPQLELIARTLNSHTGKPWVMRLRSLELVKEWAIAAGFGDFSVEMEPQGIFGVVVAHRIH